MEGEDIFCSAAAGTVAKQPPEPHHVHVNRGVSSLCPNSLDLVTFYTWGVPHPRPLLYVNTWPGSFADSRSDGGPAVPQCAWLKQVFEGVRFVCFVRLGVVLRRVRLPDIQTFKDALPDCRYMLNPAVTSPIFNLKLICASLVDCIV